MSCRERFVTTLHSLSGHHSAYCRYAAQQKQLLLAQSQLAEDKRQLAAEKEAFEDAKRALYVPHAALSLVEEPFGH